MIQILGIRTLINEKGQEKKYDAFFDKNWRVKSLAELFENLPNYLAPIPEKERFNLFYTIANCGASKREFESQDVLVFDLDGIDTTKIEEYADAVLETLHLKRSETGLVNSGNGLHILIGLKKRITDKSFFVTQKLQYKALCSKINLALAQKALPGGCDSTVFDPRRILRLPGTENRKPNKEPRRARIMQHVITPIEFDLAQESGVPLVKPEDVVNERVLKKYPHIDVPAVLQGCEFLKWAKDKPNDVNEPQWYAALSIVGRMPDGKELAHEFSRGHKNYSEKETDLKLTQALSASGPRTCENIDSMSDACQGCAYKNKVTSPIMIHGKDYLQTESTGFHTVIHGKVPRFIPNYSDLKAFFERQYHFKNYGGSRMIYVWNGKHYSYLETAFIEQFANEHFDPLANNNMRSEFRNLVSSTNVFPIEWFTSTTQGYINFNNGVLNIEKRELEPHSAERGFLSVLPFDYDKKAECPKFLKMLDKIMCGDETLVKIIQEFFGYVLVNEGSWMQKALVLVGEGANGKSTLLNILKAIVGSGNYAALSIREIAESEYSRMLLDGRLVNIGEEAPTKSLVDSSMFKNIVTGGELQMRHPYKESIFKSVTCKQIFSCNEIPRTRDASHGFLRRLIIIPFNHRFTRQDADFDPHIEKKLKSELPGIFNWAMRGYDRLKEQQKFTDSTTVQNQIDELRDEIDTVRAWVKHHLAQYPIDSGKGKDISLSDIYDSYSLQTKSSNEIPLTKVLFFKQLRKTLKDYSIRFAIKKDEKKKSFKALKNVDLISDADIQDLHE